MNHRQPQIGYRFYLAHNRKRDIPYATILDKWIADFTLYANDYGEDGFLSERVSLDRAIELAHKRAKQEYNNNQECKYSIEKAIIHNDDRGIEEVAAIEARKDFAEWLEPGDVTVMTLNRLEKMESQ